MRNLVLKILFLILCVNCFAANSTTAAVPTGTTAFQSEPVGGTVSIWGRVFDPNGRGVANVRVTIENPVIGGPRTTVTSQFGYYRFDGVEISRLHYMYIRSKSYYYTPRMINAQADLEVNLFPQDGTP